MTKQTLMMAGFAATILAGCGDAGPKLVSVKGTVLYKDKPLEGANVSFIPDGSNPNGLPGGDVTGPEGDYHPLSNGRLGLVPGKYKVTVKKLSSSDPEESGEEGRVILNRKLKLEEKHRELAKRAGKKVAPLSGNIEKIEGTFEREVPPEGGVIDLVVKTQASDVPAAKK